MRYSLLLPLLLGPVSWEPVARGKERYYIIIFGSQSTPRLPRYTHTWATFVKASGEGPDSSTYHIDEVFTISWLPADLVVRSLRLRAQEGVNLDLEATLAYVLQRERVSEWGPFEITQRLYDQAVERKAQLESGSVKYKAIDPNFGPRVVTPAHVRAQGRMDSTIRCSRVCRSGKGKRVTSWQPLWVSSSRAK